MPTQKELLIELRDKQIAKHGKDAPSVKALQQHFVKLQAHQAKLSFQVNGKRPKVFSQRVATSTMKGQLETKTSMKTATLLACSV